MKSEFWKKHRKKIIILAVFMILLIPGLYNKLKIQYYTIDSEKITNPVRIVLVTDLHSCQYGEQQQELIQAVKEQCPDLIALSGDIFDENLPDANTEYFLEGIADDYPCYYVTGNHEYYAGTQAYDAKMEILKQHHVNILSGTAASIVCNKQKIIFYGIEDPAAGLKSNQQLKQVTESSKNSKDSGYHILLSHRPELFENYLSADFDLVLSGHAHGGQWRIPFLVNGLYAPHQGIFPKYAGGCYQQQNTTMIVSRGLAKESTRLPRIYNRPELVVIDLI